MVRFRSTAIVLLAMTLPAKAADLIAGPVEASVVRVVDGDTIEVEALVWPGHRVRVAIRIRGIDAPELRSRCAAEKVAARVARSELERIVGLERVFLVNVGPDKYFGRAVADVKTANGAGVAEQMAEKALVRLYDGGTRVPFCRDG